MDKNALYYTNPYLKEFTAEVLSCFLYKDKERGNKEIYAVILSENGFYPGGGGQEADRGFIGDAKLVDIKESEGGVLHLIDRPIEEGLKYQCRIDWDRRFRFMQKHTAEHILSGIICDKFSCNNVGFHMSDIVTIDFDTFISSDELDFIEKEANRVIWDNREIRTSFPTENELSSLKYRSKQEHGEDLRIVEVEGVDVCACCALHVNKTGEIGLIKIISASKHRGGIRIEMIAGVDAFLYLKSIYTAALEGARLLSRKPLELPEAIRHLLLERNEKNLKIAELNKRYFHKRALEWKEQLNIIPGREGELGKDCKILCEFSEGLNDIELGQFAEELLTVTGIETVAVFNIEEGEGKEKELDIKFKSERNGKGYSCAADEEKPKGKRLKYVIMSNRKDTRSIAGFLNSRFNGKGGGRKEMAKGIIFAEDKEIAYKEILATIRNYKG